MKSLLVIGMVILLAGAAMALFGAVYSTMIITGTESGCGAGCSASSSNSITSTYYLYWIWSPPTWSHPNYGVATPCAIQSSWYTPFNPPPACIPPPVSTSTDYTINFIGIILILFGVVVAMRGYGQHPTHGPTPDTEKNQPHGPST